MAETRKITMKESNVSGRLRLGVLGMAAAAFLPAFAATETIAELAVASDVEVNVAAGEVKRIEYVSGTQTATLTKTGAGTLEIAIVGNTNATFWVEAGVLKFVRPGALALTTDEAAFHVDGSASASYTIQSTANGTNFVKTIIDVDGRDFCATNSRANYYPWIATNALNGLSVFDFGTYHGSITGSGAPMAWETPILPNEVFYVWADDDAARAKVAGGVYGPNPLCMLSAGYRGTNYTAGTGWELFRTQKWMGGNLYLDDEKAVSATVPGEGWHLLRTYTTSQYTHDNWTSSGIVSYGAIAFGYRRTGMNKGVNPPYGGFRLAEVIVCSNYLSVAKREYVNFYLQRKWFGGYPLRKIVVAGGATLDAADAPLRVSQFLATGDATVNGTDNIRTAASTGASGNMLVPSGAYAALDRSVAAIPNLGFTADGEVSIAAGATNALNKANGAGTFTKSGDGTLWVGHLETGFTGVSATGGTLVVNPLLTPAGALHVAADDADAFTTETVNGTNFVTRWEDVSRNGQALVASTAKYQYTPKATVNRAFLTDNRQNGLPVVDFGTMADSEHQYGWGAAMDVLQRIRPSGATNTADECGVRQTFIVWGDDDEAIDRAWVEDGDGVVKPFVGPSLYGSGGTSWRGPGGAGAGYPYMRSSPGSNSYREGLRLDATDIGVTKVGTTMLGRGFHLADHQVGAAYKSMAIDLVGGNETSKSTNGPYQVRGVFGGVHIGEFMAFRYHLPALQRTQIENALGVKWFGTEPYSLRYAFDSIAVANGATLDFPYADVTVTNAHLSVGTVSARSLAAVRLDLLANTTCAAPLALAEGGTLVLHGNVADGFAEVSAPSVALGARGNIDLSGLDVASLMGRVYRVIASETVSGIGANWRGRGADGFAYAKLETRADGVYVRFCGGLRIIMR